MVSRLFLERIKPKFQDSKILKARMDNDAIHVKTYGSMHDSSHPASLDEPTADMFTIEGTPHGLLGAQRNLDYASVVRLLKDNEALLSSNRVKVELYHLPAEGGTDKVYLHVTAPAGHPELRRILEGWKK